MKRRKGSTYKARTSQVRMFLADIQEAAGSLVRAVISGQSWVLERLLLKY